MALRDWAVKHCQEAVTHCLDETTPMLRDHGFREFALEIPHPSVGRLFIPTHQAAVLGDISHENRRQPARCIVVHAHVLLTALSIDSSQLRGHALP
jgi:hypothetical protein